MTVQYVHMISGRKRSRRTMQPRDSKELELDVTDAMYSSSQQINGQHKPGMLPALLQLGCQALPSNCMVVQQI